MTTPYFDNLLDRASSPTLVVRPRLRHRHEMAGQVGPLDEPLDVDDERTAPSADTSRAGERAASRPATEPPPGSDGLMSATRVDRPPRDARPADRFDASAMPLRPPVDVPTEGERGTQPPSVRADPPAEPPREEPGPYEVRAIDTPAPASSSDVSRIEEIRLDAAVAPAVRLQHPLPIERHSDLADGRRQPDPIAARPAEHASRRGRVGDPGLRRRGPLAPSHAERRRLADLEPDATPVVHVTIGRVEVRAVQAPLAGRVDAKRAVMPLDEYLRERARGRRP